MAQSGHPKVHNGEIALHVVWTLAVLKKYR
jgi:hypothetical protein